MAQPGDKKQALLDRQRKIIEESGWTVMMVLSDGHQPSFAYTVGLSDHSHPELMTIGLPPETAHHILRQMARLALANTLPTARGLIHEVANTPLSLRQDDDDSTMGMLCRFAQQWSLEQRGRTCGVMQVIYPDEKGKFPWERGCDQKIIDIQDPVLLAAAEQRADDRERQRLH